MAMHDVHAAGFDQRASEVALLARNLVTPVASPVHRYHDHILRSPIGRDGRRHPPGPIGVEDRYRSPAWLAVTRLPGERYAVRCGADTEHEHAAAFSVVDDRRHGRL